MPRAPRLTAPDAERLLLRAGFNLIRTKGSHRIDLKETVRVVVPFHGRRVLHPKIVRQVEQAIQAGGCAN